MLNAVGSLQSRPDMLVSINMWRGGANHGVTQSLNIRLELGNAIVREGLCRVLAECPFSVRLVDGPPELCEKPDIVILDPTSCNERLFIRFPQARFVLLDTGLRDQDIKCLLSCHRVRGIIAPHTKPPQFFKALSIVHCGQIWIEQKYLQTMLAAAPGGARAETFTTLSSKDKRIVLLIADGCKNREIAEQLFLSEATIKAHVSRIFRMLGVANRAQLVGMAIEHQLLPPRL